jgi:hypothetical protein
MGTFVLNLTNTYTDLEQNLLCSVSCPCVPINTNLWPSTTSDLDLATEMKQKFFNGTYKNVNTCPTGLENFNSQLISFLSYVE